MIDEEQQAKNQVSYVFSREVILKDLRRQGIISDFEFERYDQMLYDRYQLDSSMGIPRPTIVMREDEANQPAVDGQADYISLTAEAKKASQTAPGYVVQSWLRDSNTIAFLHYWELKNNVNFNAAGYDTLLEELKNGAMTLTAKKWIESTNAVGLQSKLGKYGGTYAHPEIACAFCAWLQPEFHYTLIQSFLTAHSNWGRQG